ncbi:MAG TPA: DEAD/DEAH box helicase [Oscillatoriaceae cyanobacterium]
MAPFSDLGISPARVERLEAQGITEPSPVQAAALPPQLSGRDALVEAPTGTGKTLAYLLPLLARLDAVPPAEGNPAPPQALVLVPTPELAMQVRDVARGLWEGAQGDVVAIAGGGNPARQVETLKKSPRVVIGTPGRLLEFVKTKKLPLASLRVLVADEVDLLLDQGNRGDVEQVLRQAPVETQRVFVSATLGAEAESWAEKLLKTPEVVRVSGELKLPETITHLAFVVDQREKLPFIRKLVAHYEPVGAIAFANRNEAIPELVSKLRYHKIRAAGLHGAARKDERAAVMRDFRAGKLQMLVASDLAARGLDLSGVSVVFNLDLPTDAEHYVHRVGRTGRMGRQGTAITVVSPQEAFVLEKFEKALGIHFERPVYFHGEVRERTEKDEKREARKAKSKPKPAEPSKPKNDKQPSAKQIAKGKARKAKRKAAGVGKWSKAKSSEQAAE